jgi:hypothetical protein
MNTARGANAKGFPAIYVGDLVEVDLDGTPWEGRVVRVAGPSHDWYYATYRVDLGAGMVEEFLPHRILRRLSRPGAR